EAGIRPSSESAVGVETTVRIESTTIEAAVAPVGIVPSVEASIGVAAAIEAGIETARVTETARVEAVTAPSTMPVMRHQHRVVVGEGRTRQLIRSCLCRSRQHRAERADGQSQREK